MMDNLKRNWDALEIEINRRIKNCTQNGQDYERAGYSEDAQKTLLYADAYRVVLAEMDRLEEGE